MWIFLGDKMSIIIRKVFHETITWVLEENKRARLFYEKCGFIQDGVKRDIEISGE